MGWASDQVSVDFSNEESFVELYGLENNFEEYGFKGD
jgi:hypothetical protein